MHPPDPRPYLVGLALALLFDWWAGQSVAFIAGMLAGFAVRSWHETESFHRCVAWAARQIDRLAGVR